MGFNLLKSIRLKRKTDELESKLNKLKLSLKSLEEAEEEYCLKVERLMAEMRNMPLVEKKEDSHV